MSIENQAMRVTAVAAALVEDTQTGAGPAAPSPLRTPSTHDQTTNSQQKPLSTPDLPSLGRVALR